MILGLGLVSSLYAARSASAEPVPSLVAGQAVPVGQRVFISENVSYGIKGTDVVLRVASITQRHVSGGGWEASAVLALTAVAANAELRFSTSGSHPSAAQTWNGFQITVYVIHHTGGAELRVDRSRR
jgi:hypothetical protein